MAITNLTETGMPNITPARLDLIGDKAGYVGHDYFQEIDIDVTDGVTPQDLDLSLSTNAGPIASFHLYLKEKPSDADADAVASGTVFLRAGSVEAGDTGKITIQFDRGDLDGADAGHLWWSLSATTDTGSYVVGIAHGFFDLKESAIAEIA